MGVIAESPVMGILDLINGPLSALGIPNPLYDKVLEADFETSPADEQAAAIAAGIEIIKAAAAQFSATEISTEQWSGPARDTSIEVEHCVVGFFEMLGDMYIMLIEIVVQVIDYLIDIIRWIVKVCEILLAILVAIIAVAAGFAFFTGGASLAAGAAAAAEALGGSFLVIVGFVASIAVIATILLWAIDMFIEWLQDLLSSARERGCLKGSDPLPDWDPQMPSTPW